MEEFDLFGNPIQKNVLLRDKFIEPPFSILDTKQGSWKNRKQKWLDIGLKSEVGRDAKAFTGMFQPLKGNAKRFDDKQTSVFNPALCEVLYHWFCPINGKILDPFAGGSVRGIVANYLGYDYTGIDIRQEQIDSNIEQAQNIVPNKMPNWFCGDSNKVLDNIDEEFDFVLSCPPYADLEVYSDLEDDISNMPYDKFLEIYRSIVKKSCDKLKPGGYACFVVGEIRDKKGNYVGFVPDTIKAFQNSGMNFYNEAILLDQLGNAAMRSSSLFPKSQKLVKVHQNVLVFKKD